MSIIELQAHKKNLQQEIAIFLTEKMSEFYKITNLPIKSIDVEMGTVREQGKEEPVYFLVGISIEVAL